MNILIYTNKDLLNLITNKKYLPDGNVKRKSFNTDLSKPER